MSWTIDKIDATCANRLCRNTMPGGRFVRVGLKTFDERGHPLTLELVMCSPCGHALVATKCHAAAPQIEADRRDNGQRIAPAEPDDDGSPEPATTDEWTAWMQRRQAAGAIRRAAHNGRAIAPSETDENGSNSAGGES